ncbi:hypothetical protein CGH93_21760 [Vibrio parahaemolyticus]|nr:hypothetical protein CGH93_21760 [Vibrio parahaemolyticus]
MVCAGFSSAQESLLQCALYVMW